MSVARQQRHLRPHPCAVCGGFDEAPRGQEKRCHGFTSEDGLWCHCAREELAGAIDQGGDGLFAHRMLGACKCGTTHREDMRVRDAIEAVYDYTDEDGALLFQVVRKVGKKFLQRRPDGNGGWLWSLNGTPRTLYRLPELVQDDADRTVYIVEGEKDADTLAARGFLATTNPGGAGKWHMVSEVARSVLAGRSIVVVADADDPGRKHARQVEASLRDVARSVEVLEAPTPFKDVTALVQGGRAVDDLVPMKAADNDDASAEVAGPTPEDPLRGLPHLSKVAVVGRRAIVTLSELAITYAWEPVARPGWIVMLGGGVGCGKTSLLFLIVAARLNTGSAVEVLGRSVEPAPRGRWIVLIEGEVDDVATAKKLRKSMGMLGVDESALDRVIIVARKGVVVGDETWTDVEKLIALNLVSDVVLDTLARATRADSNDEQEQAAVFERVSRSVQLANPDDRPIVWTVAHTRKGDGIEVEDIAGSSQRVAQTDSVLMVRATKTPAGKVVSSTVYFKKLRHDPDEHPEPVTMTLDRDPATGAPRCRVDVENQEDGRPLETRIEDVLARMGPMTKTDLGKNLGRSKADLQPAIDTLFAAGRLRGATVRKGARDFSGIALRTENRSGLDRDEAQNG